MISEDEIAGAGVVVAMQRTAHVTLRTLGAALADLGLAAAEINALANLADRGSLSVGQLSTATGTKPSTLTSVLDRLEGRGYLVRELDPADRRSFRLLLTDAGRQAAEQVRDAIRDLERRALGRLSDRQVAGFHAVLAALEQAAT